MYKKIIITGSTDGIGKLAAIKLAKDGHHVYIHGRNAEKLDKVVFEIKMLSNNQNLIGFVADFSKLKEVEKMSESINTTVDNIDVLINNAGVFNSKTSKNENNLDIRFVVNYLAPFMLTNKLMPLLNKSSNTRIINLSSAAQQSVSLQALKGNQSLNTQDAYAQSKLAITMWSFYFAKTHSHLFTIPVNPGSLLNTNMVKEAFGHHWSSADKGADILYDLAVDENFLNANGKYFDNDKGTFGEAHQDAYNQSKIDKLIQTTETILTKCLIF